MIKYLNNNKNIIISHIADIDGMGSVILAKKFYNDIDYILLDVDELPTLLSSFNFNNYETIYICDLTINKDAINIINNSSFINKIKHFDHHLSYDIDRPNYINSIIELNNRKTCGTELFYNYLISINSKLNNTFYKTFTEAVREQDTWDFKEEEHNAHLLAYTHSLLGCIKYIDLICSLDDTNVFKLPNIYDELYQINLDNQKRYIDNANDNLLITKYKDYTIGVTISEQYRSILGNEICKIRDIDFILIINYARNTVSLRCIKDDIDLNQIAKEFHKDGGGHKKASGFVIDETSIPKIKIYNDMYLENIKNRDK